MTNHLDSERLYLRQAQPSDAFAVHQYRNLQEVAQYQSWSSFSENDAMEMIEQQQNLSVDTPDSWFQWVIVTKASEEIIGDLAVHFLEEDTRQAEIGINLAPTKQGNGFASEALQCILKFLFTQLNKHRVIAITDAKNNAAAQLFKNNGFRLEGHFIDNIFFKGAYRSEFLFAILAQEWTDLHSMKELV